MNWDAAQTCQHSLSKCGDCRALEPHLEYENQIDAKVEAYRAQLLKEHYAEYERTGSTSGNGHANGLQIPAPALQPVVIAPAAPLKLDLGCGTRKQPGFLGVDVRQFGGVDVVCDLGTAPWPWPDNSVEEVFCSHALEHVPRGQRPHFFNELYRVLKPGGKAMFITPHWASCRAYGDVTHEWPPISEFFWPYLDKQWRKDNAPHNDMYTCDFTAGYGYTLAQWLVGRNQEFVQDALTKFKEAAQDMQATLVARK